jgi:hypothetical protein
MLTKRNTRIEMAERLRVKDYDEIDALLIMIGGFMDPDDPEGLARFCLVTDMSQLSDFSPNNEDYQFLEEKLGFPVGRRDYVVQVAAQMRKLKTIQ